METYGKLASWPEKKCVKMQPWRVKFLMRLTPSEEIRSMAQGHVRNWKDSTYSRSRGVERRVYLKKKYFTEHSVLGRKSPGAPFTLNCLSWEGSQEPLQSQFEYQQGEIVSAVGLGVLPYDAGFTDTCDTRVMGVMCDFAQGDRNKHLLTPDQQHTKEMILSKSNLANL